MNLRQYKEKLGHEKGKLSHLQQELERKHGLYQTRIEIKEDLEQAQSFLQKIAQDTQNQLKIHIKDIVQLSLDTCWPREIEFDIVFDIKAGRTEAELCFFIGGEKVSPYDADGGGLVDIASLGLRISAWTLGKTDSVIFLDEPFKHLSNDLQALGATILSELSKKLNLQFIIITHRDELSEIADQTFKVSRVPIKGNKISKVDRL